MSRLDDDQPTHETHTSFDPSRTAFERLRVAPTERLWMIELGKVLDGVRDHVITHLGDAGDYVEDVIEQAEDPSSSRTVFLDTLDRLVVQWSPGRGDAWMIDLLRRYTPRSGFLRLVEMFRLPAFSDDPHTKNVTGLNLRLRALHALERYFPAPPLHDAKRDGAHLVHQPPKNDSYAIYLSLLSDHVRYPRYKEYAVKILTELQEERMALQRSYETCLSLGLVSEQAFQARIEARGGQIIYNQKGPTIHSLDRSDAEPIEIRVPPPDYSTYYRIYLKQNHADLANVTDFQDFVERKLLAPVDGKVA